MSQKAATAKTESDAIFTGSFSTFSVKDVEATKDFYSEKLGLEVSDMSEGLSIKTPGDGGALFLYPKEDHKPATFTVFNLQVDDVETAVDELTARGIEFIQYDKPMKTDEKGIFWGAKEGKGPNIGWFADPSANILSVIEK
jgi:predicted enzyme related to lactoylglutathione lyase